MRKPIKKPRTKLNLSKTTLRILSRDQLKRVVGRDGGSDEEWNEHETIGATGDTCFPCV